MVSKNVFNIFKKKLIIAIIVIQLLLLILTVIINNYDSDDSNDDDIIIFIKARMQFIFKTILETNEKHYCDVSYLFKSLKTR